MPKNAPQSFEEFASTRGLKPRGICGVCALPPDVRAQVHWAWENGFRSRAIKVYLEPLGHTLTANQLTHHTSGDHPW